jgi:hypothetical protein
MKLLVGAIALAFAVPAAAQPAPAQTDHSAHSQHQPNAVPVPTGRAEHGDPQMHLGASHEGHAMNEGCCTDKDGNGKMDCCEKMAAKKDDQPSDKPKGN